jgi:cell division protein FtsW (lipid II flippase)
VLEPDFGTAVLLGTVLFVMLIANGARWTHLGLTASALVPFVAFAAATASYRWQRLTGFLDPAKLSDSELLAAQTQREVDAASAGTYYDHWIH